MCKAALELFAIQGYHATTLGDIGSRAGYSRALVHHYFGTKEALAEILLEDLIQHESYFDVLHCSEMTTGAEAWKILELHMEKVCKGSCDLHFGNEEDFARRCELVLRSIALSADSPLQDKVREMAARLLDLVKQALSLCARDGVIRDNIDIDQAATYYMTAVGGFSQLVHLGLIDEASAPKMIQPLKDYLHGLRNDLDARPPQRRRRRDASA